jgi:hypothetical protein
MSCPKCGKQMYSKYRDGGSVHICYNCVANMGQDFEMLNPNWPGNRKDLEMQATIKLNEKQVLDIVNNYFHAQGKTVHGSSIEVGMQYGERNEGDTIVFKSVDVVVDL